MTTSSSFKEQTEKKAQEIAQRFVDLYFDMPKDVETFARQGAEITAQAYKLGFENGKRAGKVELLQRLRAISNLADKVEKHLGEERVSEE